MKLPWNCHRIAKEMPWNCHGNAKELPWNCHGIAMELPWNCHGIAKKETKQFLQKNLIFWKHFFLKSKRKKVKKIK